MWLVVTSHKPCWPDPASPSGFATDGGFPIQMRFLSHLFDRTTILVPCAATAGGPGLLPLEGHNLEVVPLAEPRGRGLLRKLGLLPWLVRNGRSIWRATRAADALHAPIPGDVGTVGLLVASALRKPLFVRHCGNWANQRTVAERFWRAFMERTAGGRNVMLATGAGDEAPSSHRPAIEWVFASSLTDAELSAASERRTARDLERPRLITSGRQEPGKGTGLVLDALPGLSDRFPALHLDVVGDGSRLPALRRRADELGVPEAVTFHGRVSHDRVMELLSEAHVYCAPSASEGFPKGVLEALATGLPVMGSDLPVLRHLLGGGAGVLLESRTSAALADAVQACLQDPERYERTSKRASEVARGYSLERWRRDVGAHLARAWGRLREAS